MEYATRRCSTGLSLFTKTRKKNVASKHFEKKRFLRQKMKISMHLHYHRWNGKMQQVILHRPKSWRLMRLRKPMEDNPPYCRKLVSKMLPLGENVSTSHQSRDHAPSPARNDEPPPSQDNHPPPDSPNNNQTFSPLSLHNDPPLPPHKSSISPNQHSPRLAINPKITTPHQ